MNKKIKRRKYFIEKEAQSRFILQFVVLSVVGVLLVIVAFNVLSQSKLDKVLYAMRLPEAGPGGILLKEMIYAVLISVVFIVSAFLITATRLFRKINGPLLKLASDIRRVAQGDLQSTIQLRRKDEFQKLAADLNHMTVKLNGRFAGLKRDIGELFDLANNPSNDLETVKRQQDDKLDKLEKELKTFKV